MRSVFQVLIGVAAGFLLAGLFWLVSRLPSGKSIELQPAPTKTPIVVNVVGAVPRPGLYEFAEGSRVQDAINAAGGLLADADVASLNLAARLEDGQQLVIPFSGEGNTANSFSLAQPTQSGSSVELININTATLDELDDLPGIGPTTAQKIVDYRTEHGPFQSIEDIMNVSGIGPATFDRLKDLITTG